MKYSLLLHRHYSYCDKLAINGERRKRKRELYCGEFETSKTEPQAIFCEVRDQWLKKAGRSIKGGNTWAFMIEEKPRIVTLNIGGQYGWPKRVDTMKMRTEVVHADS